MDASYSCEELKSLAQQFTVQENREKVERSTLSRLVEYVSREDTDNLLILEALRVLRNAVASVPDNARFVIQNITDEENLDNLVSKFVESEDVSCLRVLMQVLANSLCQDFVLETQRCETIKNNAILIYERSTDLKAHNFLAFALLSLMQKNSESLTDFTVFIPYWTKSDSENNSEFKLLCLKHLILNCPLSKIDKDRLDLYEIIQDLELHENIEEEDLVIVVKDFNFLTDFVFKTQHKIGDDFKPREIMALLELLISISKSEKKKNLQEKSSLVINTLYLLRMLHDAGKAGNHPELKPITKLSELADLKKCQDETERQQIENNPSFGLKVKLIQLLVNLVWEHPANQNLVSEHSGLQLLLDCSQVDARNPLITQWVVMSVRALCVGNTDNQAILASLRREGVADSALWRELGINLDQQGDKIKVAKNPQP